MNREEIISVQIGKFSNQVGANVWNLREEFLCNDSESEERFLPHTHYHKSSTGYVPRCIALDLRENCDNRFQSSIDDSSDDLVSTAWVGKVVRPAIKDGLNRQQNSPYGWCETLKSPLHSKSLHELPAWSNSANFDSFSKGVANNGQSDCLPEAYIEGVLDTVRYFAEACDHLSTIQFTSDVQGGFGGLASSVVEGVADDFARSVCVPIWAVTHSPSAYAGGRSAGGRNTIKSELQALDLPLSYSRLSEHAHVLIPVEASSSMDALLPAGVPHSEQMTAFATAIAMEASTSFHISSLRHSAESEVHTMHDWARTVTCGGRYPVCQFEAYMHGLATGSTSSGSNLDGPVLASFSGFDCFSRTHLGTGVRQPVLRTLNPFAHSLSPVGVGEYAVQAVAGEQQYLRPYSNFLTLRGVSSGTSDIVGKLHAKCLDSPYMLSGTMRRATPVLIERDWCADQLSEQDSEEAYHQQQQRDLTTVQTVAAVGSSPLVGMHLARVAAAWTSGSRHCGAQLRKVGLNEEECSEVTETLLALQHQHSAST